MSATAERFECGICWSVYDPAEGDPSREVAPGTPFSALPSDWACPNCDALPIKFLHIPQVASEPADSSTAEHAG